VRKGARRERGEREKGGEGERGRGRKGEREKGGEGERGRGGGWFPRLPVLRGGGYEL